MTAIMLTVLLAFTALSIDIGLHHYLGAKLQNAVDSAATAVGSKLGSSEGELEKCAYEYLEKNGYPKDKYDMDVAIDTKGYAEEESVNPDDYISKGYMKLSVDVNDRTLFANVLGISSLRLHKESYVLIEPNYEKMPEALKYSIFAGAKMGEEITDNDGSVVVINSSNPAMDIEGTTGAGSGETAFTSIITVAENTINGANTFGNRFVDWIKAFIQGDSSAAAAAWNNNYNDLVSINVSEAVMNNDAHSNANIMIGVQALNISRTRDNDYTGDSPQEYNNNVSQEYTGFTDADDYGSVNFTAVDDIKFGYSRYAETKANNIIHQALLNFLSSDTNARKTRTYVQNQQYTQIVQHTVNILNEMDLMSSGNTNDEFRTKYEAAAEHYFKINSKVSDSIQTAVKAQKNNIDYDKVNKTITLNNQQAIVYRVNHKEASKFLSDYDPANLSDEEIANGESQLSKLMRSVESVGYDTVFRENTSNFVYNIVADTDGGKPADNDVILERYERNGKLLTKDEATDEDLKYTFTLKVKGTTVSGSEKGKVNRNFYNSQQSAANNTASNTEKDRTKYGATYATIRSFRQRSEYIEMPNLIPFFTRHINKSVRDAVTKRDGSTNLAPASGSRNEIVYAVDRARNELDTIIGSGELDIVDENGNLKTDSNGNRTTDGTGFENNTYSDATKYDSKSYAGKFLFRYYKYKSDGDYYYEKLTNTNEANRGGVLMSNSKFKKFGFDNKEISLYNSDNKLKTAKEFITEFENDHSAEYASSGVNAFADAQTLPNSTLKEKNAVANKASEIDRKYGNGNKTTQGNESYSAKEDEVANEIANYALPTLAADGTEIDEDLSGAEGMSKYLATPTNPLANDGIFLKNNGTIRTGFDNAINGNQASEVDFTAVSLGDNPPWDATFTSDITNIANPAAISDDFSYPIGSRTAKVNGGVLKYTDNSELVVTNVAPSAPDMTNWSSGGNTSGGTLDKNKYYSANSGISSKSVVTQSGGANYISTNLDITGGGKSLDNYGDLTVNGYVHIWSNEKSSHSGHINFRSGSSLKTKKEIYIYKRSGTIGASWEDRRHEKSTYVHTGDYYRTQAALDIGVGGTTNSSEKATVICSGNNKTTVTVNSTDYYAGFVAGGDIFVWEHSELFVNGDVVTDTAYGNGVFRLAENSIAAINGNLVISGNERKNSSYSNTGIEVAANAKLYVNGDIRIANYGLVNYGTIICNGTIYVADGSANKHLTNSGTIYAKNIVCVNGSTYYNITNNSGAQLTVPGTITCAAITNGGTLSATNINCYNGSTGYAVTNNSGATLNVPGTLTCGTVTNAGTVNAKTVNAYASSNYYGITNNSGGQFLVSGDVKSGAITNDGTMFRAKNINCTNGSGTYYNVYNGAGSTMIVPNNVTCAAFTNNSGGASGDAAIGNSYVKIGGNLSAHGNVTNSASSTPGKDPFLRVDGNLTTNGGNIVTNKAGNSLSVDGVDGSWSFNYVGGYVNCGSGSFTEYDRSYFRVKGKITAGDITVNDNCVLRSNGNIKATGKLTVRPNANVTSTGKDVPPGGSTDDYGSIEAASIENANSIYALRKIKVTGSVQNTGTITCIDGFECGDQLENGDSSHTSAALKCKGEVKCKTLVNHGNLYVGYIDNGTPSSTKLKITGNFCDPSDGWWRGVHNEGKIYVTGGIEAASEFYANNGEVYVYGDLSACRSTDERNLLNIAGTSKIYVYGCVYSSTSGRNIYIHDGSSSVLSVYGNGHSDSEDCFKNELNEFCNTQEGSYIYLNTNLVLNGIGNSSSSSDAKFINAGRMYVNGTISCPDMLSISLYGKYDYGKSVDEDYSADYDNSTENYSGLTYCNGLTAPDAVLYVSDDHYLYINDTRINNYDPVNNPKVNIKVRKVVMGVADKAAENFRHPWIYAPNEMSVTGTITMYEESVLNIQNYLKTSSTDRRDDAIIYAPVNTNVPNGNLDLGGIAPQTINGGSYTSFNAFKVAVISNNALSVSGDILIENSAVIINGDLSCRKLTVKNSKVWVKGNLTVASAGAGGAISVSKKSTLLIDKGAGNGNAEISMAGPITVNDRAKLIVCGDIKNTSSITATNSSDVVARDRDNSHNRFVQLSGAATASFTSKIYVDGTLQTTGVTATVASKIYGYSGIKYLGNNDHRFPVSVDIGAGSRIETPSTVFFGRAETRYDIVYDFLVNGTLYIAVPSGKTISSSYSADGQTHYSKIDIRNYGKMIADATIDTSWIQIGEDATANNNAMFYTEWYLVIRDPDGSGSEYCAITNYGKCYVMHGTDVGQARKGGHNNDNDFGGLKAGSETYLGKISYNGGYPTDYTVEGYFGPRGDLYMDAGMIIKEQNESLTVGDRWCSIHCYSGSHTYVSGSVTINDGDAIHLQANSTFAIGGNLTCGSAIWNYGHLHVYGGLTYHWEHKYPTSEGEKNNKAYLINNEPGASILVYNSGNVAGIGSMLTFEGYVHNKGGIYMNYPISVQGFKQDYWDGADVCFLNDNNAIAHFGGEFRTNGKALMNNPNATFSCGGNLWAGGLTLNVGKLYVGGDFSNNTTRGTNSTRDPGYKSGRTDDCNSMSFMNGTRSRNQGDASANNNTSALCYVHGNMHFGTTESAGLAGSITNVGTILVRGNLNDYTNKENSYYKVALWFGNDSNCFVGGDCFGGGGMATGKNSIFMCDGDLRTKRSLKIGMYYTYPESSKLNFREKDDDFRADYFYVGGNLYANVLGNTLVGTDSTPTTYSRDTDIGPNSNIYVGGLFYSPTKVYMKQNVAMVVRGKKANGSNASLFNNNAISWQVRGKNVDDSDRDNSSSFNNNIPEQMRNYLRDNLNKNYAFFVYQLLDMNINSKLLVNGDGYVKDTAKIRDMTKTYFYGDFESGDYLEIGKSLIEGNKDVSQATEAPYKLDTDKNYRFANAGYMYVGGNLTSNYYTKIYASTEVNVKGNFNAKSKSGISGAFRQGYITLRHDAILAVGGNCSSNTSVDCGVYSELYVGGDLTAKASNIKLRDQMTCYVGGNMNALSYIELGKYDEDFYRGVKKGRAHHNRNNTTGTTDEANEGEYEGGDEIIDDSGESGEGGESGQDEHDSGSAGGEGGEGSYSGTEGELSGDAGSASSESGTDAENSNTNSDVAVENQSGEWSNDNSDLGEGGDFYIGGNIVSYTSYIREYAYSRIISGGFVFSTKHVTLRHNSDLWVLPEVYGNATYEHQDFVKPDGWDENTWTRFKTAFQEMLYNVEDGLTPKKGSVYSLGQLTLNRNASILGSYDTMVFGQTKLRKGSLIYMGHDFDCWAPIYTIQTDFSSFGGFIESMKANLGLNENNTYHGFDSYEQDDEANPNSDNQATNPKPIVVFANNEINVMTTAKIRYTYLIANQGDVNFTNLDFISKTSSTAQSNSTILPNAFASYQKNVNYYALRGSLAALMYAPEGNVKLDGFAYNFYGSIMGNTVDIDTFYINVHRFNNWRTIDLHVANSKRVYMIPKRDYDNAKDNIDDVYYYGYDKHPDENITNPWARIFFPGQKDEN